MSDPETYQDDIKAILRALNISDHARPCSCHDVVHEEIIPEIRRMIGTCSSLAGMLLEEGYTESAHKILEMIGKD